MLGRQKAPNVVVPVVRLLHHHHHQFNRSLDHRDHPDNLDVLVPQEHPDAQDGKDAQDQSVSQDLLVPLDLSDQ